ncbi:TPR repeat containing protein [Beggiatoa sp. PS]|nr:TPR repeat containing protein [Beggiatoa sp. PS]
MIEPIKQFLSSKKIKENIDNPSTTNSDSLIELKEVWEKVEAFFSYLIKVSLFLLFTILFIYTSYELFRYDLIIKPFEVPLNLSKEQGYTGVVVAHRLQDYMVEIREEINRVSMRGAVPSLAFAQFSELQKQQSINIPTVGLSLNTVIQQIRKILGIKQRHISGDIVIKGEQISMTLRITGKPTVKIEPHHDIEVVINRAAEQLLKVLEPLTFGLSYYINNQTRQLEALINDIRQTPRFQKTPLSSEEEAMALILEGCLLERQSHNKDKLKQALDKFNQAQQLASTMRIIFRLKGDTLNALEEFDKAIEAYQTAIELEDKHAGGIYVQWALTLLEQKKIPEAFQIYELASKKDRDNPWVYTSWGEQLAIELKDFETAYLKFEIAQEKNPNYMLTYAIWGEQLRQEQKYEQAREKYEQALALNSNIAWVYGNLGYTLEQLAEYETAMVQYQKATELQPTNSLYLYRTCTALDRLTRYEEAIPYCKKALEIKPTHHWTQIRLAHGLLQIHQYQEAFKHCESVLKSESVTTQAKAGAFAISGLAQIGLNRPEIAIERCQIAIQLSPQEDWAYWCLGDVLSLQEKFGEAAKQYEQAVKLKPENTLYNDKWAQTLAQLGQYDAALTQYQKVLELDKNSKFGIKTQTNIEALKAKIAVSDVLKSE